MLVLSLGSLFWSPVFILILPLDIWWLSYAYNQERTSKMFEGSVYSGSYEQQASILSDTSVISLDCFLLGGFLRSPREVSASLLPEEYTPIHLIACGGARQGKKAGGLSSPVCRISLTAAVSPSHFSWCAAAWCAAGQRTLCFILSQVKTSDFSCV